MKNRLNPFLAVAVAGGLAAGAAYHQSTVQAATYVPNKSIIMRTKAGDSTVGKFLNDVLPKFSGSYYVLRGHGNKTRRKQ